MLPGGCVSCKLHGDSGAHRELISCSMCPESVRDRVVPTSLPHQRSAVAAASAFSSSADVMSDDTSVEVPCCQQHLHINCLVRSFTSCGFHCPFCNQCLSDFARSGSFQASAILQGCMIDIDAQPSNRGSNSLVVPTGFPSRPCLPLLSPAACGDSCPTSFE